MCAQFLPESFCEKVFVKGRVPSQDDVEFIRSANHRVGELRMKLYSERREANEITKASMEYKKLETEKNNLMSAMDAEKKRINAYRATVNEPFLLKQDGVYTYPSYKASRRTVKQNVVAALRQHVKIGFLTQHDIERYTERLLSRRKMFVGQARDKTRTLSDQINAVDRQLNEVLAKPVIDYQLSELETTKNAINDLQIIVERALRNNETLTDGDLRIITQLRIKCIDFTERTYDKVLKLSAAADM